MILALITVLIEMSAARGIVAFLANAGVIGLSTYSTNILTLLVIAAGTDYVIFLLGRYHERRNEGMDREAAFYDMYRGTSHVILGSGLTIAGAVVCLYFTRLPYFQSLGIPAAIGVLVALAASLTLAPAVLVIGGRFGLLEPKRKTAKRGWRRIGTAIVRWPGPILIATLALAFVGLASLSGYKVSYDVSPYMPDDAPSNVGYAAAERHFSKARLNPELLMVETDHDLRNPTDMILLERVAKAVFHTDGIAQVQSITRPLGTPLDNTSIPFQISASSAAQINNLPFQQDRAADLLKQVGVINDSIDVLRQQYALQQQSSDITHEQSQAFQATVATAQDLRDKIANFDDFFRPLRNYFYWEPHCFNIPICFAIRSLFDALDGINQLTDQLANVSGSIAKLDELQPKLLALIPPQIANQETNRDLTMTNHATTAGIYDQTASALENATKLGEAYNASDTDDSFYLPPEAFSNSEFLRGLKLFLSPDGKAARMIITHDVDPATPEGISHIDAMRHAAQEAIKGTPLAGSKIYIGGTASTYKDIAEMAHYDLIIAAHRRAEPDSADHDVHHAQHRRGVGHRGHGGVVVGCVDRPVGVGVAAPVGHRVVLGDHAFGGDPAASRGVGLQPAAGVPVQGGDPCRHQHRHHPVDGGQRLGGDRGGVGVRVHHGVVHRQRPDRARPDRHDDRVGSVVRHADRAVVHDAVDRRAAGAVVLVAGAGAPAAGAYEVRRREHAAAVVVLVGRPAVGTGAPRR